MRRNRASSARVGLNAMTDGLCLPPPLPRLDSSASTTTPSGLHNLLDDVTQTLIPEIFSLCLV